VKKGDIILVPFPFTDLKGSKNRPAVVLWTNEMDVIVSFITSELKWQEENDITIAPDENNGLKTLSLIRVNKIATIDVGLVLGILGYLSAIQINSLNKSLFSLLQLRKTY
jgi:mRNA interferase MazF